MDDRIYEELKRLNRGDLAGSVVRGRDLDRHRRERKARIENLVEGSYEKTPHGPVFVRSTSFSPDFRHGDTKMCDPGDLCPTTLSRLARVEEWVDVDPREMLFLDTETTGLAGGAGTYAFMVGFGYWTPEGFQVDQFFMRDYDEEPALLHLVRERAERFSAVVSYNGKSYDVPLLRSRFIQNRLPDVLGVLPHLDLLHPARRLWKRRLSDCSLGNVERMILGVQREEDIPGHLIPHTYFRFVRGGDPRSMVPVFTHNALDILSLVQIAAVANRRYKDPPPPEEVPAIDLYSLGRSLEMDGEPALAVEVLEDVRYSDLDYDTRALVMRQLSTIYKRRKEWDKAIEIWRELGEADGVLNVYCFEEMAKYYEHQEKDPEMALELVNGILEALDGSGTIDPAPYSDLDDVRATFKHRRNRLDRKSKAISPQE